MKFFNKREKVKLDKLTDYCFSPFIEIITSSKKILFSIKFFFKREKVR